ncbi:MAG: SUMF1/EgtB/PvdO family nonheme iron enzyme [Verrucomicrobiae bacterium]|nr:SUMF1/EgtB/PvdO family nonheme iron enzyme [Verrucomicrobiae bacterium]
MMLGKGGMGAVYYGYHEVLDRPVAIKVLRKEAGTDFGFADRFKREARAMAALEHPNIVRVYDFGETGDFYYIVMEYVDGADLKKAIRSGEVSPSRVFQIMGQVCDALDFAHRSGLIHRDIKPANILLTRQGVVKVCDFGLAKITLGEDYGNTISDVAMGTPDYIAPEALIVGSSQVDHRADVYSLGVMLYEMLTGRVPRGNQLPPSKQNPNVHPKMDAVIDKALSADPNTRYGDVTLFAADLERVRQMPRLVKGPIVTASKAAKLEAERTQREAAQVPEPTPSNAGSPNGGLRGSQPSRSRPKVLRLTILALLSVLVLGLGWTLLRDAPDESPSPETPSPSSQTAEPTKPLDRQIPARVERKVGQNSGEGWTDFFEAWERNPQRSASEWENLQRGTEGWQSAKGGGINAYLMDSKGTDLAIRLTAKFDSRLNPKDGDQVTVRLRRTPRSSADGYNEVAAYWFFSGEVDLRVVDDAGTRKLIAAHLPAEFDPLQFHSIEVSTRSSQISLLVDGREIGTVEGDLPPKGGLFGFNGGPSVVFQDAEFRDLEVATDPSKATKEAPFENTLGMRFVPVPITGGPTDGQRVLFSIWETRVKDYETFAKATNTEIRESNAFPFAPDLPIINVSWPEATAFCEWLTRESRRNGTLDANLVFRLPTDHEWSCAVGIGGDEDPDRVPAAKSRKIDDIFPWGSQWPPPDGAGNFRGEEPGMDENPRREPPIAGYDDGFPFTAPVGRYAPNRFGLFDLAGNVGEWCVDFYGSKTSERDHVYRGLGWGNSKPEDLWSSARIFVATTDPYHNSLGFRVVLGPPLPDSFGAPKDAQPETVDDPAQATKDTPFENTLGMRFVPVPITGGPTDGQRVLFSVWETRVKDYEAFAKATQKNPPKPPTSFEHTEDHPVVNVSWEDATAFCEWLTTLYLSGEKSDQKLVFRLPTDHEWSCAAGIGDLEDPNLSPHSKNRKIKDVFPWGKDWPPPPGAGNYLGQEWPGDRSGNIPIKGFSDGYPRTAPVGQFRPNPFGLFDLGGNVYELTDDWYMSGHPEKRHAVRGGSNGDKDRDRMLSSDRNNIGTENPYNDGLGFRVVLSVAAKPSAVGVSAPTRESGSAQAFGAYPEVLEVPIPDWLQKASREGGRLAFLPTVDVPEVFDLGEASAFDDFVAVYQSPYAWLAVRKSGEVWGKTWSYEGKVTMLGPIRARSITRGNHAYLVDEEGVVHIPYGGKDLVTKPDQWENPAVSATTLERATGFLVGGRALILALDRDGNSMASLSQNASEYTLPPSAFFRNAVPVIAGMPHFLALESGRPLRAWNPAEATVTALPEGTSDAVELDSKGSSILLRKDGTPLVLDSGFQPIDHPANAAPAIRVRIGIGIYAQKPDGTWVGWSDNPASKAVAESAATLGPALDLGAGSVQFSQGAYEKRSLTSNYLVYIVPKNQRGDAGASATPAAATKETPFENSLGMRFVPVPITGGPTDGQRVLFSIWETRVKDYEGFVRETNTQWNRPEFGKDGDLPTVMVSWEQANAFCDWLTRNERGTGEIGSDLAYRLPSDHEWSCAAGIGTEEDPKASPSVKHRRIERYSWGHNWPPPPQFGNFYGEEARSNPYVDNSRNAPDLTFLPSYRDDFPRLAPVGTYSASQDGLFDLFGNVREWCADGYETFDDKKRTLRGGGWHDSEESILSLSARGRMSADTRSPWYGFRVVLSPVSQRE